MEYITKEGLINALKESGINKGDTIIVHSDISSFGVVENFTKKKQLETFYNAFMEVLGEEGTLCVPSFFFEYGSNGVRLFGSFRQAYGRTRLPHLSAFGQHNIRHNARLHLLFPHLPRRADRYVAEDEGAH